MDTILVVDDEYAMAEAIAELLAARGYAVTTARDGREGLAAMARARPSAVLLDYMMPVMNGLQTLAAIRADPALRDVPVVMMSAASIGVAPGAQPWDALLRKPFGMSELLKTLERVLGRAAGP